MSADTTPSDSQVGSTQPAGPSGTERVDVVVIGGGQAGLAMGYHLARRGLRFVILEAHLRIGDSWRTRWDSLRLFTPAVVNALPGLRFPAREFTFPTKDQMAEYLERYAATFELPIRTGIRVDGLHRSGDGDGYVVAAVRQRWLAPHVVLATGAYAEPRIPAFARQLDPGVLQLHSSEYRNPAQLRAGGVLVVGAGNSGAEIALDVAHDHRTWLSGRDPGHLPLDNDGRLAQLLGPLLWLVQDRVLTINTPMGRKARPFIRSRGGLVIRANPARLQAAGVERIFARTVGARDGSPMLDDGRVLDVANVIWCTGFEHAASWVDVPMERTDGWPREERGVVLSTPGLYMLGLPFLYAMNSSLVGGVGRDAAYLADVIASQAHVSRSA